MVVKLVQKKDRQILQAERVIIKKNLMVVFLDYFEDELKYEARKKDGAPKILMFYQYIPFFLIGMDPFE